MAAIRDGICTGAAQYGDPAERAARPRALPIQPAARRRVPSPAGPRVALPGTVAPKGAEKIRLRIRDIRIEGSTVYSAEELRLLYQDLIGPEVTLSAVYDLAQRITTKYGVDGYVLSRAIVPPQNLAKGGAVVHIQVIEGYVDKVVWPELLARFRDFFSYYAAKIIADRPSNVRTIERYLLLAGDLPGLKFSTSLKASEKNPNAATLLVEVAYKPVDAMAQIDNRGTPARGPLEYLGSATANNLLGANDAFTVTYAGVVPTARAQLHRGQLPAGAHRRGPRRLRQCERRLRQARHRAARHAAVQDQDALRRHRPELPGDPHPRAEPDPHRPVLRKRQHERHLSASPFNDDRLRGIRFKVDADMADAWRGINQFNLTFSQGINGLGSTSNSNPLASRLGGRVDFTKFEATANRTQPLFGMFSAVSRGLRPICHDVAAHARAMQLRRPLLRPRLRSLAGPGRQLLHGQCRAALRLAAGAGR